jgi:hypothetical protein
VRKPLGWMGGTSTVYCSAPTLQWDDNADCRAYLLYIIRIYVIIPFKSQLGLLFVPFATRVTSSAASSNSPWVRGGRDLTQKLNSYTYNLVEVSGHTVILRVLRLEVSVWIS